MNAVNADSKIFSERFVKAFEASGMTVRKFTKLVGCRKTTYYNWRSGNTIPTGNYLIAISKALNISCEYLLGG